ncbi:hypothetical protein Sjap_020307 [Stephania japonica]|uniref:Uncharacterized protein n=1 Tax=Stephania japonica TaxID=461633 RepID=A0AAP0F5Q1_9MAGN
MNLSKPNNSVVLFQASDLREKFEANKHVEIRSAPFVGDGSDAILLLLRNITY